MSITYLGSLFMCLCASCLLTLKAHASTSLTAWEPWVLQDYPRHDCPWTLSNDQRKLCVWPGTLHLAIDDKGGDFHYVVEVFERRSFVPLPGSADHWPDNVLVNGQAAAILDRQGAPFIVLTQGEHRVSGRFHWKNRPGQLAVPDSLAAITLTLADKPQIVDRRGGHIIFSNKTPDKHKKHDDSITIEVFRLVQDGVPVKMITQVNLSVTGKPREVAFGQVMLDNTEVLAIRSPFPARIEEDGSLRAQVTPGEHSIQITARFTTAPTEIQTQKRSAAWPSIEYISFQSAPAIRQTKRSGATSIDTRQVNIPRNWAHYPTYRLTPENHLRIETEVRGEQAPAANELKLQRNLWLDFDGQGMTAFDRIHGAMHRTWRLNAADGVVLGRATVDGDPVLITRDGDRQGIEIRSPAIDLDAISRTAAISGLFASGWDAQVDQYQASLHLPPGWRVLYASGVDSISGTWLSQWSLWNVFLLLIIISATRKLMGNKVAVLAALTFMFAFHENASPLWFIPLLLAIMAVLPLLSGNIKRGVRHLSVLLIASLVLTTLAFAVNQFRLAIYPSLALAQIGSYQQPSYSARTLSSSVAAEAINITKANPQQARQQFAEEQKQAPSLYQVTEKDRVQTGPGLPTWTWQSVHFRASGPLPAHQKLSIFYSKPWFTALWLILSVLLVMAYSSLLVARIITLSEFALNAPKPLAKSMASLLLMGLSLMVILPHSQPLYAEQYPPEYLLDTLKERLTKAPSCLPDCVSLYEGHLEVQDDMLTMRFAVYADAQVALPLPKGHGSWLLHTVTEKGSALPLRRVGDTVFVALDKGHHRLQLKASLIDDQASLDFPIPVRNLSVTSNDWLIEGLVDGRAIKNTLTLRAIDQHASQQADTLKAAPVPTFARVKRHITFGKRWAVTTTVIRETTEGAVSLPITLLPNERLLTNVGVVDDGVVTLQFDHRKRRIQWQSSLAPVATLALKASEGTDYVEEWLFTPSSLWRLDYEGMTPLKTAANAHAFAPTFKPWPGESLQVHIRKPEGVPGPVHTVERALLKVEAGDQLQRSTLTLTIRASIGTDYPIVLPETADVLKFSIDGKVMNTPSENTVIVPLQPREQTLELIFQTPVGVKVVSDSPAISLPGHTANITLQYQLPRDRWPLYLRGPAIGPAMLYWGVLLVIILGALCLPYLARRAQLDIPVSTSAWLLLGLGLSTVNSYGVLVIAALFFILAARKRSVNPEAMTRFQFNSLQLGIVLWAAFAIFCLLVAIPMGLLSSPEMKVVGNLSGNHFYNYYQDRATSDQGLPIITVVSVPLFTYRVVMLLWSLWLSTQLIRWAIWGWGCYKEKSAWMNVSKTPT
ncbi:MAG: hypothetical protein KTR20_09290 [Cellvibrionaceae bacterium]|nr:hypothetical protein [Cellvibrionaceae bacterium]